MGLMDFSVIYRLRDAANEQEAELNLRIKELEIENFELADIKGLLAHGVSLSLRMPKQY